MPIAFVRAINSSSTAKSCKAFKAGLPNTTIFCKDSKVMLLKNLWKEKGLSNGAIGVVKYIVYDEGVQPPQLPKFVLVKFEQYTGPSFLPNEEKIIPILPFMTTFFAKNSEHNRTMIPLTPAYSISIHKAQGKTLEKIIINVGTIEFASGLTYTAISRAKKLENVAFDPFPDLERFIKIWKKKPRFDRRLKEEKMLQNLS